MVAEGSEKVAQVIPRWATVSVWVPKGIAESSQAEHIFAFIESYFLASFEDCFFMVLEADFGRVLCTILGFFCG